MRRQAYGTRDVRLRPATDDAPAQIAVRRDGIAAALAAIKAAAEG